MGTRAWAPAVAAVLLLGAVGCGTGGDHGSGATTHDPEREWAVAADPDASAAEIIAAGRAADVASADGTTLITYLVQSDDDEGPQQGAWRLYDADGTRVADGRLGIVREQGAFARVSRASGGYLLENYTTPLLLRIGTDGTSTPVAPSGATGPARPGDLLVDPADDGTPTVYRPSTGTTLRLPELPTDNPQSVRLDDAGTLWVLLPWTDPGLARVAWSAGGAGPWHTERVRLGSASYPLLDLEVAGGRVLLATGHDGSDEYPVVDGIHARPIGAAGTWEQVPLGDLRLRRTLSPRLGATADGRVIVLGEEGTAWVEADGGFRAIEVPGEDASGLVVTERDWYLLGFRDRVVRVSEDEGASWSVVRR